MKSIKRVRNYSNLKRRLELLQTRMNLSETYKNRSRLGSLNSPWRRRLLLIRIKLYSLLIRSTKPR